MNYTLKNLNKNTILNDVYLGEILDCSLQLNMKGTLSIELKTHNSTSLIYEGYFDENTNFNLISYQLGSSVLIINFSERNKVIYHKIYTKSPINLKTKITDILNGFIFVEIALENITSHNIYIKNLIFVNPDFKEESDVGGKEILLRPRKRLHKSLQINFENWKINHVFFIEYETNYKSSGRLQTSILDYKLKENKPLYLKKAKDDQIRIINITQNDIYEIELIVEINFEKSFFYYIDKLTSLNFFDLLVLQDPKANYFASFKIENEIFYYKL